MTKLKSVHGLRVGDVVEPRKGKGGRFVVCGTKGWVHSSWRNEDGTIDSWISLTKEMGAVPLLSHASEYKLVAAREDVGPNWWQIFPKGEK